MIREMKIAINCDITPIIQSLKMLSVFFDVYIAVATGPRIM